MVYNFVMFGCGKLTSAVVKRRFLDIRPVWPLACPCWSKGSLSLQFRASSLRPNIHVNSVKSNSTAATGVNIFVSNGTIDLIQELVASNESPLKKLKKIVFVSGTLYKDVTGVLFCSYPVGWADSFLQCNLTRWEVYREIYTNMNYSAVAWPSRRLIYRQLGCLLNSLFPLT